MAAVTIKNAGVKGRLWHLRGGGGVDYEACFSIDARSTVLRIVPLPHFVGADTIGRRVLFGRHEFGISG